MSDDAASATGLDLADVICAAVAVGAAAIAGIGAGQGDGQATAALFDGGAAAIFFVFAVAILVARDGHTMTEGAIKGAGLGAQKAGATVGVYRAVIDATDVARQRRDSGADGLGLLAIKAGALLAVDGGAALIGAIDQILAEERLFEDLLTDAKPSRRGLYTGRPRTIGAGLAIT